MRPRPFVIVAALGLGACGAPKPETSAAPPEDAAPPAGMTEPASAPVASGGLGVSALDV